MSRISIPRIESLESTNNFGHFIAEPLEKGFGITIGNAMRRVLSVILPCCCQPGKNRKGIQHELSVMPYIKEDVTQFLLNVKNIRLKSITGQPAKFTPEVEGEGQVLAADIKPSADFEIVNPELYLATLDSPEAKLTAEFDVELGEGYHQAESSSICPSALFQSMLYIHRYAKRNYTVEPLRVGRETNKERLHLEIWTDNTITPSDAVSRAAAILVEQLSPLVSYAKVSKVEEAKLPVLSSIPEEIFNKSVDQLNLSVRTMNCLRRGGIATVGELTNRSERDLLTLRNFGQKSLNEIIDKLAEMGLSLKASQPETEQEQGAKDETQS